MGNGQTFHTAEQLCAFADKAATAFNAPWSGYCQDMAKLWAGVAKELRRKANGIEATADGLAAPSVSG
eukprot:3334793-Alexandrium_andersonii.AAC.1